MATRAQEAADRRNGMKARGKHFTVRKGRTTHRKSRKTRASSKR